MTITHAENNSRNDCGANHGGTWHGAPANGEQPALPSAGCFIFGSGLTAGATAKIGGPRHENRGL